MKSDYKKELQNLYEKWNYIYEHGGNDPFWEDGTDLNLLRNHIMSVKKRCEMELEKSQLPEEYYKPLPPVVENSYMAQKEQIEETARLSLQKYQQNPDYKFLLLIKEGLDQNTIKNSSIKTILGYVTGLETAIQAKDYVTMRRHNYPERYLSSFKECRKKIESSKNHQKKETDGQLSLFDFM